MMIYSAVRILSRNAKSFNRNVNRSAVTQHYLKNVMEQSNTSSPITIHRLLSSSASPQESLSSSSQQSTIPSTLLTKKASVRRTFSPNSNAQAMLVCGGKELAAHASFDPEYKRAKGYIQNHAVGPAVLSPILISGLVGALIESTLPQSFFVEGSMKQVHPLIVGVEVEATIEIKSVLNCDNVNRSNDEKEYSGSYTIGEERKYHGYELLLDTQVKRVSDGVVISKGNQTVWLPDYGHL